MIPVEESKSNKSTASSLNGLRNADPGVNQVIKKFIGNVSDKHYSSDGMPTACEENQAELLKAWDDVTGKELNPAEVIKARDEEIAYIHKSNLYTKVPRRKAKDLRAKVITVRWIDINKGDVDKPN